MNQTSFLLLFLGLGVAYLLIGLYASRQISDKVDYFLAGRKLGFFAVMLTLVATQLGGGVILGTSNEAYDIGYYGLAYSFGIFLGFTVLALGFAKKLRGFNVATTAELFETQYQSALLRKIAAVMMMLSMCGILAGQVVASRLFLHGLGITHEGIFLIFWAFIIFYTVMGGLKAVVLTDIYQVCFIFILFVIIFFVLQGAHPVSGLDWSAPAAVVERELNWQVLLPMLLLPLMFCIVEQDLAQRIFSARSQKVAMFAALGAAGLILLFALIPAYFGVLAKQLAVDVPANTSVLIAVMRELVPDIVLALVACGLLAAIVSTADSLLCAISSNMAQDFGVLKDNNKTSLQISRFITLAFGVLALVIAYYMDNILQVLVKSYELPVSALFASIVFCCLLKKVHKQAALYSVFAGLAAFIFFKFYETTWPNELIQIALSFIGYGVGFYIAEHRIRMHRQV